MYKQYYMYVLFISHVDSQSCRSEIMSVPYSKWTYIHKLSAVGPVVQVKYNRCRSRKSIRGHIPMWNLLPVLSTGSISGVLHFYNSKPKPQVEQLFCCLHYHSITWRRPLAFNFGKNYDRIMIIQSWFTKMLHSTMPMSSVRLFFLQTVILWSSVVTYFTRVKNIIRPIPEVEGNHYSLCSFHDAPRKLWSSNKNYEHVKIVQCE